MTIQQGTVLILGAGASHPYDFPLGQELVDQIIDDIEPPATGRIPHDRDRRSPSFGSIQKRFEKLGFTQQASWAFSRAMKQARPLSVDRFLETRREFRDIGKAAIADVLLRREAPSMVTNAPRSLDWYRHLNNVLMTRSTEHFVTQARRLTVITFNFDRSFEYSLFEGLKGMFRVDDDQARLLATELHIHHIHGTLGEAKFLYPENEGATRFGVSGDEELIKCVQIAARQIRIVDEEIARDVVEDAQLALQQARHVYVLGFGFDERNMQKLNLPDCLNGATVRGTAVGFTDLERQPVTRFFGGERTIHLYMEDVLTFLRSRAEALIG